MTATLYTIGFTKSSAEHFFGRLRQAGIKRLVDIRLNNTSTLAGFTKRDDLAFFLRSILDVEYVHEPLLAPTPEMLKAIQGKQIGWDEYAAQYNALIQERDVATSAGACDVRGADRAAVQRGDRRALPPPPRRRAPERGLGRAGDRPPLSPSAHGCRKRRRRRNRRPYLQGTAWHHRDPGSREDGGVR